MPVQVYKILLGATSVVEPVSCDEAYLDVTGLGDPECIAARLRTDIQSQTGVTASAGRDNITNRYGRRNLKDIYKVLKLSNHFVK